MLDLWGDEILQPQPKKQKPRSVTLSKEDCFVFGHSWTLSGMTGEKLCTACGIKGYCPVCAPLHKANDAQPFLCSRHSNGRVQA